MAVSERYRKLRVGVPEQFDTESEKTVDRGMTLKGKGFVLTSTTSTLSSLVYDIRHVTTDGEDSIWSEVINEERGSV